MRMPQRGAGVRSVANTYAQLYFHLIWSTKERTKQLHPAFRERLYEYIRGIIRNEHGHLLQIGGIEDHIHLLINAPLVCSIPKLVQYIKAGSSKWINQEKLLPNKFAWQEGYGAFSVSTSLAPNVQKYIQNQEEHHRSKSFKDEYIALLKAHGISFKMEYVFD